MTTVETHFALMEENVRLRDRVVELKRELSGVQRDFDWIRIERDSEKKRAEGSGNDNATPRERFDISKFSVADIVIAASIVATDLDIADFGKRLKRVLETPSEKWFMAEAKQNTHDETLRREGTEK